MLWVEKFDVVEPSRWRFTDQRALYGAVTKKDKCDCGIVSQLRCHSYNLLQPLGQAMQTGVENNATGFRSQPSASLRCTAVWAESLRINSVWQVKGGHAREALLDVLDDFGRLSANKPSSPITKSLQRFTEAQCQSWL